MKCVSSAYAKLMLCISLLLTSVMIFLRHLLEKESKKDFSKAYAMHKLSSLLAYAQHMRALSPSLIHLVTQISRSHRFLR